jgi:hypothetical protein
MPLKPKLAALRRQVGKMLAAAPASGQGRGWVAIWTWNDWIETLVPAFASEYPRTLCSAMAAEYIAQRAAEHLGITAKPAFVAVQTELTDAIDLAVNAPSPRCAWHKSQWQEHASIENRLHSAYGLVAAFVMEALGFPTGLQSRPPGGYQPKELPEWLFPPGTAATGGLMQAVADTSTEEETLW